MTEDEKSILAEYIKHLEVEGRMVAGNKSAVRRLFEYFSAEDIDYRLVRMQEAQEFQQYLTTLTDEDGSPHYSPVTVATIIDRVRRFYRFLTVRRYILSDPFRNIDTIRRTKSLPRAILTEEEMSCLLARLKDFSRGLTLIEKRKLYRAHIISELMYSTGARINEIEGLTLDDVDFSRGTVRLRDRKTGKEREGILNSFAYDILMIYIREMRPLILSTQADIDLLFGSRASLLNWLNTVLRGVCANLGYERMTTHGFRHALGTHLLRAGCDIRYIQEILGHAELATTQIYTRVVKEDLRGVIDEFHPRQWRKGHETA